MGNTVIMRLAHRDIDVENRPYREFLDMKVVYELRDGKEYTPITNEVMAELKLNEEELFKSGINNIIENELPRITGVSNLLKQMIPEEDIPDRPGMYVLTGNENNTFGAALVLVPEVIESLERCMFNGEFYAIPSSVHEFLLLDKCLVDSVEYTNAYIKCVNDNILLQEDVLSDHLYTSTELKAAVKNIKKAS